jgi:hypothetical protein
VKNAIESKKLHRENVDLKKTSKKSIIVGDSIPMKASGKIRTARPTPC